MLEIREEEHLSADEEIPARFEQHLGRKSHRLRFVSGQDSTGKTIGRTVLFVSYWIVVVGLVMATGILIVVLTTPQKTKISCPYTFHSFPPQVDDLDSQPRSVVIADLNHDYYLDLALLYSNTHTLAIYLGRGDGIFDDPLLHFLGAQSRPVSVAVGHLNNDDHRDVVVADAGTHSISVMFGLGNGTFIDRMNYATFQCRPRQVSLADMNRDGRLDMLVLGEGTNEMLLFDNRGDGTFVYSKSCSTGADSSPCFMVVADMNGDGRADVIVANNGTDDLIILIFGSDNRTDVVDQKVMPLGVGADACALVIDDIDHDGTSDLIVTKSGRREIGIWRGYSNGSFRREMIISTNQRRPFAVGVADFNQDKQKDLLVIHTGENCLEMFLGQANGSFISDANYSSALSSSNPSSLALADMNNDFRVDAVVSYIDTNSIAVFLGFNQASFHTQTWSIPGYTFPISDVSVVDFNGDHHADVIGSVYGQFLAVMLGNGTGYDFQKLKYYRIQAISTSTYLAADLNKDRRMDLITCGTYGDNISVYLQTMNATFLAPLISPTNYHSKSSVSMRLIDVNSDAIPDFFLLSTYPLAMVVILGYGNGTFHHSAILTTAPYRSMFMFYDLGDINQDGLIDVVVAIRGQGIYAFFGSGNGSFANTRNYTSTIGLQFAAMALTDMNNDQYLDLITIDDSSSTISLRLGDGQGGFDYELIYPIGVVRLCYAKLFVGDFNGDSNIDLAISCTEYYGEVHIFCGLGNGSLVLRNSLPLHLSGVPNVVGDFNEDGRLDWITISNDQATLLLGYDSGALSNPTTYTTGSASRPSIVVAEDFNRDAETDLAFLTAGQESITVRFGRGDGTFGGEMTYSTGEQSSPQTMVMGDFNDDGITDLVVVNAGTDSIALFVGRMNGNFVLETTFSTEIGAHPSSIIAAHLNDDDWLDLAVTNANSNTLSLFIHSRYPRLAEQKTYQMGVDGDNLNVIVADFNSDHHLDMAVVNNGPRSVGVFLGDGTGNFTGQFTVPTTGESWPSNLLAAHMDDNDRTDLVYTIQYPPTIIIFLNFNQSSWSEIIPYQFDPPLGRKSISVVIADVNNDHYADLIIFISSDHEVRVVLNQGTKTFASPFVFMIADEPGTVVVRSGYFNDDLDIDLVFINSYMGTVNIYFGHGNGTFSLSPTQSASMEESAPQILCTDVNNDGLSDLVLAYPFSASIEILLSPINPINPMRSIIYSNPLLYLLVGISHADFNQDGHSDLVILLPMADGLLMIAQGRGDGTFGREAQYKLDKTLATCAVAVGDLNHDGISDVVLNISPHSVVVPYLISCCDPFTTALMLPNQLDESADLIATGDFNRDNRSDLLVSYADTNQLGLFLSHGNGTFDDRTLVSIRSGARVKFIAVADLNNDGRSDLIMIRNEEKLIEIYLDDAAEDTFQFNQSYSIGASTRPHSLLVVDFNNDTHLDIIVGDDGTNSVGILLGNGDGSFRQDWHFYTGYATNPSSMAIGDFDNDGEWDLVVTMSQTNTVGMIAKRCSD